MADQSVIQIIQAAFQAIRNGTYTPPHGHGDKKPKYAVTDVDVDYVNGQLIGNAQIRNDDPSNITNGASIFLCPPGTNPTIYCSGTIGPPANGTISVAPDFSLETATTNGSYPPGTQVEVLVIIVFNNVETFEYQETIKL